MNRVIGTLLWVLLVVSLALNALTLAFLVRARQVTLDTLHTSRVLVDDISRDTIAYDLAISQTVPLRTVVPLDEQLTVPISTVIPLDTTVSVSVNVPGIGPIPLSIPVNGQFPVNINVPVHVRKDVNVAASVPISTTLPVRVPISQTQLAVYLQRISTGLADTARALGDGAGQNP